MKSIVEAEMGLSIRRGRLAGMNCRGGLFYGESPAPDPREYAPDPLDLLIAEEEERGSEKEITIGDLRVQVAELTRLGLMEEKPPLLFLPLMEVERLSSASKRLREEEESLLAIVHSEFLALKRRHGGGWESTLDHIRGKARRKKSSFKMICRARDQRLSLK
jgi:hypothetical protein